MFETVGGVIFGRFSNVDNFRLEVDSDLVSGVVDPTGVKVPVNLVSRTVLQVYDWLTL